MGASGLNRDPRQCQGGAERLGADDARHGFAAAPRAGRHLLAIDGIAANRRVNPAPGLHDAPDERDVFLFDLAIAKLPRELRVRAVVLGDNHQTGGAAIEPVYDTGTLLAADPAEVAHMM